MDVPKIRRTEQNKKRGKIGGNTLMHQETRG